MKAKLVARTAVFKFAIVGVTSFLFLAGCQATGPGITTPKVIDGFSSPESVIADSIGKYFFVSNVGEKLAPSAKDGDGFISRLSADGEILDKRYLPKTGVLHAPKGMAIIDQVIFVTDIDRVVGFNLITRKQTFELDFSSEGTTFLNDPTVVDDKTLMVSATDIGKIYKISLDKNPHFTLIAENIPGANGLYFDPDTQRLFVVTFGEGYQFDGKLGILALVNDRWEYQALSDTIGALDGIAFFKDSKIIFSDWVAMDKTGLIRTYDLKTKRLSLINLSEEVDGPADFFYDKKNHNLWLPEMKEGKILIEEIK